MDPVSDPLLSRKSGSVWNRSQDFGFAARTLTTRPQTDKEEEEEYV
jgi:hypothetical protein